MKEALPRLEERAEALSKLSVIRDICGKILNT